MVFVDERPEGGIDGGRARTCDYAVVSVGDRDASGVLDEAVILLRDQEEPGVVVALGGEEAVGDLGACRAERFGQLVRKEGERPVVGERDAIRASARVVGVVDHVDESVEVREDR